METAQAILQIYKSNQFVIARNIESLTHEESLLQPEIEANNLNWILGHILVGRMRSSSLLGIDPTWGEGKIKLYERGSDRVTALTALPLTDLEADLDLTMASLTEALSNVDGTALEQSSEDGRTVGQQLLSQAWHETYHAGQTDYLRRLAGKQQGGIR
ncbi:MAG: hypothetical protein GY759_03140 [Chloroflexi bacterium]|nr:hypothetical protein [Chloroflexota bacterium]